MKWSFLEKAGSLEKTQSPTRTCPECGSKLSRTDGWSERTREPHSKASEGSRGRSPHPEPDWYCPNPDCPAQVRRGLMHWCAPGVMDIPGGDAERVALLAKHGLVLDVAELYRLKLKELAALPGMTPEGARTFFDAITASLKREAWRLLLGLQIPLVGVPEAQALARGFPTVDAIFAAGVPRLVKEGSVSEAVARSVVHWFSDGVNRKLVKRLEKFGLNFKCEAGPG